jgi:hypothetical protein
MYSVNVPMHVFLRAGVKSLDGQDTTITGVNPDRYVLQGVVYSLDQSRSIVRSGHNVNRNEPFASVFVCTDFIHGQ